MLLLPLSSRMHSSSGNLDERNRALFSFTKLRSTMASCAKSPAAWKSSGLEALFAHLLATMRDRFIGVPDHFPHARVLDLAQGSGAAVGRTPLRHCLRKTRPVRQTLENPVLSSNVDLLPKRDDGRSLVRRIAVEFLHTADYRADTLPEAAFKPGANG